MMSIALAEAPPLTATPPLTLRLRQETRAEHERIEANSRFSRLMAPDLTMAEYRLLVARLHGHHAPLEAALEAMAHRLPACLALHRRLNRRVALADDLVALGFTPADIAALPRCEALAIRSVEQALGALYVLEGSTLGGQLIARHLRATLGIGAADGAAHVVPYGPETGTLWRDFRLALDAGADAAQFDPDAVIAAARRAFDRLDRWMAAD
ncbi:biliverdin-producing heme oxygenase [Roseomonas stagni]|uniref:Biliverdin-producing heme oxygenase n=1 Tax=Falsiroseomonas algicola TaxID=2716930 RepID=A0A6M1LGW4_9PROT|nr:biliverdin-producing heme oxygenase [Falsiroseomonas algicola]NGM19595.1 biliverdin-producing heme oxygenase [Falsiroseomonas algicola]